MIDLLRDELGLTGTKEGCSVGVCGACSVLVDGQLVSACLLPAAFVDGTQVTTIEGLAPDDEHLTPLQDAFIRHGGFQCGICTPGQIVAATALLAEQPTTDGRAGAPLDDGQPLPLHGLLQDRREHPRRRRVRPVRQRGSARRRWGALMRPYALHQPESLAEALELLAAHGDDDAHLIAGGTSMILLMTMGLVQPGHLIALRKIAELHGIRPTADGGLRIGALATHRQLELAPEVRRLCPALSETFGHVATVRIRNQATLGGNLVHADPAQDPPPMLIALDAAVDAAEPGRRADASRWRSCSSTT